MKWGKKVRYWFITFKWKVAEKLLHRRFNMSFTYHLKERERNNFHYAMMQSIFDIEQP